MPQQQTTYHPKENHPWRQYRNKKTKDGEEELNIPSMSLQIFLRNIVDNWETYKIPPTSFEEREYISLKNINPDKQAEWLIGFIKKHWLNATRGVLIFE